MKFLTISDVHLNNHFPQREELFSLFIQKCHEIRPQKVFLLGDIFDLMVGNKKEYLEQYSNPLRKIRSLIDSGIDVIFIEGNHDFALQELFDDYFESKIEYCVGEYEFNHSNKKIILTHGDDLDLEDKAYRRWKYISRSSLMKSFVNNFLPYKLIEFLGNQASMQSKKRGIKNFNYSKYEKRFQALAATYMKNNDVDLFIAGHTHITSRENGYYNGGFFPETSAYILFDNNEISFKNLLG